MFLPFSLILSKSNSKFIILVIFDVLMILSLFRIILID